MTASTTSPDSFVLSRGGPQTKALEHHRSPTPAWLIHDHNSHNATHLPNGGRRLHAAHPGSAVFAMSGSKECWCGDQLPAVADKVDDTSCNQPCVGFPDDTCGGNGFYSVYTTGGTVDHYGGDSSSSSSASSSSSSAVSTPKSTPTSDPPTVVTSMTGGQTVVVTVPASARATASETSKPSSGGGPNTAGIAAGVVVGVVAIAGMALGGYFFMRHKRRREAEEDFKQRTHVDNMMRAGSERKPPGTSYSGMSDQRLDPEAGRRNSVGSLADNQDYSRRILRVANPSD
ncbi:unnamed protein product [Zymoseptoria tritici ST99CH_3D7]|uniref:WSC domain-containing protein n=1 Tax=Zymoseptoria tritici (strain ST99CH_3D7) TaxID=1276538 RepID=A0A1X7S7X4_ZYMT9|nr:unnamed protein product [Zymoseptoria tritici ST99CH_3D7]